MFDRVEVDAQIAAHALLGERRDAVQPQVRAAEEVCDPVRASQIEMRVVFPGDSDTAEHLNAVLGVGLRGVDPGGRGHRRGDRQLPFVGIGHTALAAVCVGGHRRLLGTQQHLGTHVLDRLEAADRLAELLAHLRILRRGLQRPAGQPGRLGRQHGRRHVSEALR